MNSTAVLKLVLARLGTSGCRQALPAGAVRQLRRTHRLHLEELEARCLPSTFPPPIGLPNPPSAANAEVFQVVNGSTDVLAVGYDTVNGNQVFALWRYTSSGALDTSFGQGGLVTTDFGLKAGGDRSAATAVTLDAATGDIVAAGYAYNALTAKLDFAVAVYGSNGSPVAPFGSNGTSIGPAGTVTNEFGAGLAQINALAIDSSRHQIVAAGYAQNSTSGHIEFTLARYNFDGSLDSTFGAGTGSFGPAGTVTTDFSINAQIQALVIDPAGRYVAAGYATNTTTGNSDFALARYTTSGALDTTFGAGSGSFGPAGTVTTDFSSGSAQLYALAVNSSGQYLVAGSAFNSTTENYDFTLARYSTGGSLDSTFGAGTGSFGPAGTVTTDFASGDAQANALAILSSTQQVVVAGYALNSSSGNTDFALARYNTSGSLDTTFGAGTGSFGPAGTVTIDFGAGGYAQANALLIDSSGKYVAAGYAINPSAFNNNLAIARLTTTGAGDSTFGAGSGSFGPTGTVTWLPPGSVAWQPISPPSNLDAAINAMTFQVVNGATDILVAGYDTVSGNQVFGLWRYTSSGTLDTTFGSSGFVTTDFGPAQGWDTAEITALALDPTTGDIVAAGYAFNRDTSDFEFAVALYSANGTLLTSFGSNGTSFGPGGTVTTDFGATDAEIGGVAVDPTTHQIVVAGYVWNNTTGNEDFALARYNFDGSLDTAFGAGTGSIGPPGTVTTDFGNNAGGTALLIDSAGRYVVAGDAFNGTTGYNDFALARYGTTGSLDTSFGAGTGSFGPAGTVITDFGQTDASIAALAVNTSGQYVVAGYAGNPTTYNDDFALARYSSGGALDTTFGAGTGSFGPAGTVTTDFGTGDAWAQTLVIVPSTQQIVVAGAAYNGSTGKADFALGRYGTGGGLDTSFGAGTGSFGPAGTVTIDFGSGGYAQANSLGIDPNGKYVAAGYAVSPTTPYDNLAIARLNTSGSLDTAFGAGTGSFGPAGTVTWAPTATTGGGGAMRPHVARRPSYQIPPQQTSPSPAAPAPAFVYPTFAEWLFFTLPLPVVNVPPPRAETTAPPITAEQVAIVLFAEPSGMLPAILAVAEARAASPPEVHGLPLGFRPALGEHTPESGTNAEVDDDLDEPVPLTSAHEGKPAEPMCTASADDDSVLESDRRPEQRRDEPAPWLSGDVLLSAATNDSF